MDLREPVQSIREYVKLAMRPAMPKVLASEEHGQLYAAMGLSSEAGEVNEIIKKRYYHDHPYTEAVRAHLMSELGDLAWYFALMCHASGFDPAAVLSSNIAKLRARYPEGFSTERSLNRAVGDI